MKKILLPMLVGTLLVFNACCTPTVVTKYVPLTPNVIDLNYTNDTNYTVELIDFYVIEEDINETAIR